MEKQKSVSALSLSLIDYLTLHHANKPEGMYGYQLHSYYEAAGKKFNAGSVYRILRRLAADNLLLRSSRLTESDAGPKRRMFNITDEGKKYLDIAAPVMQKIVESDIDKNTSAKQKSVAAVELSLMDYIVLINANNSDHIYPYEFKEQYESFGHRFNDGSVTHQLGRLAAKDLLHRMPEKMLLNKNAPARRLYSIAEPGKEVLLEAVPLMGKILDIEIENNFEEISQTEQT